MKYIQYVKISERTKLTLNFMKRKMEEYDILKKELNNVDNSKKFELLKMIFHWLRNFFL